MKHTPESLSPADRVAVSANQAADLLSISRTKIYQMMVAGELPYLKLGRSRRIVMADLMALIERQRRAD